MEKAKYLVWDCDSSLYDSVELKSFQRHLNSAILSTRSLSMPRHIDPVTAPAFSKKASILPRTLQKLIRSFFKSKPSNNNNNISSFHSDDGGSSHVIDFQRFGVLTTIPEIPENLCNVCINGGDDRRSIRRSASLRLSTGATGISCA